MVIPLPRPLTTPPVTTMYFMAAKDLRLVIQTPPHVKDVWGGLVGG
jgi:hypothetical protein